MPDRDPKFAPSRPSFPPPSAANGAIYQAGYETQYFADSKPRRVGDVLTVILVEAMQARNNASTDIQKNDTVDMPDAPTLFGHEAAKRGSNNHILHGMGPNEVDIQRQFQGQGTTTQGNAVTGTITVTILEVLPNGGFVVQGEKRLVMNQGAESVKLRGIVRPQDIQQDNSVLSTRLADVELWYSGEGALAHANRQGWMSRFFSSVFFPF